MRNLDRIFATTSLASVILGSSVFWLNSICAANGQFIVNHKTGALAEGLPQGAISLYERV